MPEEGSRLRALAILLVGLILVVSTFSFFSIVYPGQPPSKSSSQPFRLFVNQFNDSNNLGISQTNFSTTAQKTVLVQGYLTNSNSLQPIASSRLWVAVYPLETVTTTDSVGYYQYLLRYTGSGYFAYTAAGYNTSIVQITANSAVAWVNVTLTLLPKYAVAGTVSDIYGHGIAGISSVFSNYYQSLNAFSNSSGIFRLSLYNESYIVNTYGNEYTSSTVQLTISGGPVTGLRIRLAPRVPSPFNVSGTVYNTAGVAVENATVTTYPVLLSTRTNSTGFYSLADVYGTFLVNVSAPGYSPQSSTVSNLVNNFTSMDFRLVPVSSIGSGLSLFNITSDGQTGDPAVNSTTLINSISASAPSGPSAAAPISLTFIFNSGTQTLADLPFIAYVYSDGILYRGLFSTGSSGAVTLSLNYSGFFGISFLTLDYGYYTSIGRYTGPSAVTLQFTRAPLYNLTLSAVCLSANFSVPASGLSVENTQLNISSTHTISDNSTFFYYSVPSGEYFFSYSGAGFLNASEYVNISGADLLTSLEILPYKIVLYNNSSLDWNVTFTTTSGNRLNSSLPVNTTMSVHAIPGTFSMNAVSLNGTYFSNSSFSITPADPVANVYVGMTYANASAALSGCISTRTAGTAEGKFYVNLSAPQQLLVSSFHLSGINFTLSNATMSFPKLVVNFTGNNSVFATPLLVNSTRLVLLFNSTGLNATQVSEVCKLLTIRVDYQYAAISVKTAKYSP